ncbi:hypothetical protein [Flavobacterium sp. CF136]|uniref:hypothetical protein n=1 Tax=Flavobacterium sp. (strain CF136) TaxID=1144313 RepID=UPI000271A83E|nr:hypothetical protein [Flavobacterium sp. CF136]EJL61369.1 hypothetical protein PMI10_03418 [Flavobacterium sp. CF136]
MIWIIDFFDFIFAEENLKTEIQTTIISKYNIIDKMALHNHIYNTQLLNPGFDLGRLTIQVHQYRQ